MHKRVPFGHRSIFKLLQNAKYIQERNTNQHSYSDTKGGLAVHFFFNPPYGLSAGLRSSYIADFTMALKAISRMRSLISSGMHSSLYNVATFTYFSWSRMRAVVRDDCEVRESRSESSSGNVAGNCLIDCLISA
jgi:hypothetical protein